jgi:hypothetical protein
MTEPTHEPGPEDETPDPEDAFTRELCDVQDNDDPDDPHGDVIGEEPA